MEEAVNVVVIGGGFSGIAAACRLAGEGHRPILLERAARLGGRAASFHDRATGADLDYGHHVSMRCCTATHGFLLRIGAASLIRYQDALSVRILHDAGRAILRSLPFLPGPLHLAPALLAYRPLDGVERLRVLRAGMALLFDARSDESFRDWLRVHGQSPRSIERLWNPICVATLNADADGVSLKAARHVFRTGIFRSDGAGLGLFTVPLSRVFDAARAYIESRDGDVRTSAPVRRIHTDAGSVCSIELADGGIIEAEAVVVAVPPWDLVALVPGQELRPTLDKVERLTWSPIVNVHLWFDRLVLEDGFVIAVDSPIQAVFNLSRIHSQASKDASHLVLSQSAADPWIDRSPDEIADELIGALGDLVPRVRAARVKRRLVVKHRRATFVPAPGADALRPSAKAPIEGLYLAGDWTATGWPSTIEGSILSGVVASARVEEQLRTAAEISDGDPTL